MTAFRSAFLTMTVNTAQATEGLRRVAAAMDRVNRDAQHRATTGAGLVRRERDR